jgi:DivIVA domain-containing protein
MRVVLRRLRRLHRPESPIPGSGPTYYRSASYKPLHSWQVRTRQFRSNRFGQRGLDPDEVYDYLDRIAGDLDALRAELAASQAETKRIKDGLRQWQSRQAGVAGNGGRW